MTEQRECGFYFKESNTICDEPHDPSVHFSATAERSPDKPFSADEAGAVIEIRSVDGFTALSIGDMLRRKGRAYREGFRLGYLIGRASALDEQGQRRFRRGA